MHTTPHTYSTHTTHTNVLFHDDNTYAAFRHAHKTHIYNTLPHTINGWTAGFRCARRADVWEYLQAAHGQDPTFGVNGFVVSSQLLFAALTRWFNYMPCIFCVISFFFFYSCTTCHSNCRPRSRRIGECITKWNSRHCKYTIHYYTVHKTQPVAQTHFSVAGRWRATALRVKSSVHSHERERERECAE